MALFVDLGPFSAKIDKNLIYEVAMSQISSDINFSLGAFSDGNLVSQVPFAAQLVKNLRAYCLKNQNGWTGKQLRCFNDLINAINQGNLTGILKHPSTEDKDSLIAHIIAASGQGSIVNFPLRVNCKKTRSALIEAGVCEDRIHIVSPKPGLAAETLVKQILDVRENDRKGAWVVLMTYRSLFNIFKTDTRLFGRLMNSVGVIIENEAHSTSTGQKTQEAVLAPIESKLTELVPGAKSHLQIFVSATPQRIFERLNKPVSQIALFGSVRLQESLADGSAILPTYISMGKAVRTAEAMEASDFPFYQMEDGTSLIERAFDIYLAKLREHGGYLPTEFICASIPEAEEVRIFAERLGLNAVRCTSACDDLPAGINPADAIELIEKNSTDAARTDIVASVDMLGIGCGSRALRCIVNLRCPNSPVRSLDNVSAIMSALRENDSYPAKTSANTYLIEPTWIAPERCLETVLPDEQCQEAMLIDVKEEKPSRRRKISIESSVAINTLQILTALKELDVNYLISQRVAVENIVFDVFDDEHLKLLIGHSSKLIQHGLPLDLSKLEFENETLGWMIPGEYIFRKLYGSHANPIMAAKDLACRIFSKEAQERLLDPFDDEHLRSLFRSPIELLENMQPTRNFRLLTFANQERGWQVSGEKLGQLLFDCDQITQAMVATLIDRLWPPVKKDAGLVYADSEHLRRLFKSPDDLRSGDFFSRVFISGAWQVSGRLVAAILIGKNEVPNFPRLMSELLIKKLFLDKPGVLSSPSKSPVITHASSSKYKSFDPTIYDSSCERGIKHTETLAHFAKMSTNFRAIGRQTANYIDLGTTIIRGNPVRRVECSLGNYSHTAQATTYSIARQFAARGMLKILRELELELPGIN